MDFKDISMVNVLFVSDLFGNGDPALYTYSDGILRHVCCLSMCLYGFLCTYVCARESAVELAVSYTQQMSKPFYEFTITTDHGRKSLINDSRTHISPSTSVASHVQTVDASQGTMVF